MSHWLNTAELIECAESHFRGNAEIARALNHLIDRQTNLASLIAEELGVTSTLTVTDDQEITTGFEPLNEGDPCPDALYEYDQGSDWAMS